MRIMFVQILNIDIIAIVYCNRDDKFQTIRGLVRDFCFNC